MLGSESTDSSADVSHMLGFPLRELDLEKLLLDLAGAMGWLDGGSATGDTTTDDSMTDESVESSASLLVTPKKLATASQEVFSRDFSAFGFSATASGVSSCTGAGTIGGSVTGAADSSVFGFCGAREGVPSKLAREFQ